jgi:hypothetical protein
MGFGLDLSKARTIQQETLEKNEQIIQRAKENVQAEGASLTINIANIAKIKEVEPEKEEEVPIPVIRRGAPDIPIRGLDLVKSDSVKEEQVESSNRSVNSQVLTPPERLTDEDFDMKGTSRKEYENEYYKRICSEVIDDFLYLGSDFIA